MKAVTSFHFYDDGDSATGKGGSHLTWTVIPEQTKLAVAVAVVVVWW